MKPRPMISALVAYGRPLGMFSNHSLRSLHSRTLTPALSCHNWPNAPQRNKGANTSLNAPRHRTASTNTASSQNHHPYARAPPPTPTSTSTKSPKLSPPAKTSQTAPPRSVPAKLHRSKSTTVPTLRAKELLNPPPFTYPPPVDVPAQKPDQGKLKYYYSVARTYLVFYKTSISHVRQTLRLAKTLRAKVAQASSLHPGKPSTEILSRAEWQVVRRSALDKLRLPAFGVLFLLFGEWLPVVALYLTPVIPEACRIPQQVLRSLKGVEKRRAQRLEIVDLKERAARAGAPAAAGGTATVIEQMGAIELARLSARFDCHAQIWDWLFGPPTWWLRSSVRRKLEYLSTDDRLIVRDGGWAALERAEVERACAERGFPVVGKGEDEMRRALAGWKGVGVTV